MSTSKIKHDYQKEEIARSYDQQRFSSMVGRIFDMLEKRALRSALNAVRIELQHPTVLDIPCGTGRITELWLREGLTVVGGDISEAMLTIARHKCQSYREHAVFRCLDLDTLEVADREFQLVSCIRLFHHLESAERLTILKDLSRVSSRFVIVNVSYSSLIYRLRRRLKRLFRQGVSKTSSRWSEIGLEAESAGLRVSHVFMVCPIISEDMVLVLEKVC